VLPEKKIYLIDMSILLSILDVTFSFGGVVKKRREGSARSLGVLFVDQSELGKAGYFDPQRVELGAPN
jgi:hypothetical protein